MKRKHLFEFEDHNWFPQFLRNYMTDFLQFISNRFGVFNGIAPDLIVALRKTDTNQLIDLASGGGGGLISLAQEIKKEVPELSIILTDYYPNITAFKRTAARDSSFNYREASIDAREVPSDLKGLRTQFLSLHHFKPEDAVQIIQNAVDSKQGIAFFEGQERNIQSVLAMVFSPINVLIMTPFIRPFSWGRIVFTYLIPLVPLFVMVDGILSALRTYTVSEMEELVSQVNNQETFEWKIGKKKSGSASVLYLIGTPK